MSPTAEQLIRDYLNRVSVAARTKLHSEDRRAFLARMRFSIERHCGPPGTADPAMVARVLARLGAPEKLVDAEVARITAARERGPQAEGGGAPAAGGTDAPQTGGRVPAGPAGPRLASPQGIPQRPRRTPSPWLVSGSLNPPGGAARSARRPLPANPVLSNRQQPTGEIKVQSRPITSRWRPGAPLQPRQPKPKEPRRLRMTRGGKARDKIKPGDEIKAGKNEARESASEIQPGKITSSDSTASENTLSGSTTSGSTRPAGALSAGARPAETSPPGSRMACAGPDHGG